MPELVTKEVYFNEYCKNCKFEKTNEADEPCRECLKHGSNEYSHKPVKFKEK